MRVLALFVCVVALVAAVEHGHTRARHAAATLAPKPIVPAANLAKAAYPRWAHEHWVWLRSGHDQAQSLQLVKDYQARGIRVGATDIDSKWSSGINNFKPRTDKFPDFKGMVDEMHSLGVRVILWATSFVDTDADIYAEGKAKGYYLNDGKVIHWWHGHGSLIDYTNDDAVAWWHAQMDHVLDLGVDGFKCDGSDPYVLLEGIAHGKGGLVTHREYADAYYGDFFDYSRSKNPDALIMSRPMDSFDNYVYLAFSPRRVVLSGWVGDQDPTFAGLRDALRNMIVSAWHNYVNYGSDVGGYRSGGPKPFGRTRELFTRWYQMGAFVPLFENGGDNEHRPWMFDTDGSNATLDNYRTFVNTHYELIPYLLTCGSDALEGGHSVMLPMELKHSPIIVNLDYKLGEDIFVAPMTEEGAVTRDIRFPSGAGWVDWWDTSRVFKGDAHVKDYAAPLTRLPVFHRAGSLLPLEVTTSDTGHGHEVMSDALTFLLAHPQPGTHTTHVRDEAHGVEASYTMDAATRVLELRVSACTRPMVLLVRRPAGSGAVRDVRVTSVRGAAVAPARVTDVAELHSRTCMVETGETHDVFVRVHDMAAGAVVRVEL